MDQDLFDADLLVSEKFQIYYKMNRYGAYKYVIIIIEFLFKSLYKF